MSKEILRPQKAQPAPVQQEPVAWMDVDGNVSDNNDHNCFPIPLYTTQNIKSYLEKDNLQPEQEPVAWMNPSWIDPDTRGWQSNSFESIPIEGWLPIYTTPPQRPWVSLTDEEISDIAINNPPIVHEFARAIEAKLRSKNT